MLRRLREWWRGRRADLDTCDRRITDATTGAAQRLRIVADEHGATVELIGVSRSIVIDLDNGELRVFPVNEFGDVTEAAALSIPVAAPAGWTHVETSVDA